MHTETDGTDVSDRAFGSPLPAARSIWHHLSPAERFRFNSSVSYTASVGFIVQNSSHNLSKLIDVFKFTAATACWMSEYAASWHRQFPGVPCAVSVALWPCRVCKDRFNLADCGIFQPGLRARDFLAHFLGSSRENRNRWPPNCEGRGSDMQRKTVGQE